MRKAILAFIDFFHPPFQKYISIHNFRYLVTGGTTFVLGFVAYWFSYHFIFTTEEVKFWFITLKRGTAAFVIDFAVAIPFSFIINKYIVFTHSEVKGHTQFFRFLNLQWINILTNVFLYKFLTEMLSIFPTVARFAVALIVALFSYLYQHYFTFSVKKFRK